MWTCLNPSDANLGPFKLRSNTVTRENSTRRVDSAFLNAALPTIISLIETAPGFTLYSEPVIDHK